MTTRDYSKLPNSSPVKTGESATLELGQFTSIVPQSTSNSPTQNIDSGRNKTPVAKLISAVHPDPVSSPPSTASAPGKSSTIRSISSDVQDENGKKAVYLRRLFKMRHAICCVIILVMIGLVVFIAVTVADRIHNNSDSSNPPQSYVNSVFYTSSACSASTAIYQIAYPLDQCLSLYINGVATDTKEYSAMGTTAEQQNITSYTYQKAGCVKANLINYLEVGYGLCNPLSKYPGYYQQYVYTPQGYSSILNSQSSLNVLGYSDTTCTSISEMMSIQLDTCLPITTSSAVSYSVNSTSNALMKLVYGNFYCTGKPTSTSIVNQKGCVQVTGVSDTVSPYRSKDVLDCFTSEIF